MPEILGFAGQIKNFRGPHSKRVVTQVTECDVTNGEWGKKSAIARLWL